MSVLVADESSMPNDVAIAPKRKQWTKRTEIKEFQSRYKVELNSRTYNCWVLNETILQESKHWSEKIGYGRKAFYPEMNKNREVLEIRNNDNKQ